MSTDPGRPRPSRMPATANDQFKSGWNRSLLAATLLGVVFHAVVLFRSPEVRVQAPGVSSVTPSRLLHLANLPDIDFRPAPPTIIAAPALPTMQDLQLDLDMQAEIALPQFEQVLLTDEGIAPPIRRAQDQWLEYKHFAPYVVRPQLRNRNELARFLQRSYQPIYEYTGATGVVQVTFWIDEAGLVEKAEIRESSGSRSLDRLALRLSRVLRFRPAMMAGRPIRILVHMPITFRAA